jgi:hypothetical protein
MYRVRRGGTNDERSLTQEKSPFDICIYIQEYVRHFGIEFSMQKKKREVNAANSVQMSESTKDWNDNQTKGWYQV